MHRPAMVELRVVQHAPHRRGFRAYQVHEALPLVGHLPRAVLAVQLGGGQESDVGQVDESPSDR
jgi:hypothetical protein